MALLRTVETDLRSLSMEARRRFPEVKEAAERALQRLRTAQESLRQDAPLAEQAAAVATSEEVLLPSRSRWRASRRPSLSVPSPPCSG